MNFFFFDYFERKELVTDVRVIRLGIVVYFIYDIVIVFRIRMIYSCVVVNICYIKE